MPDAFDGFRIAFISDLHYKSLFKEKGLESLVRLLNAQHADVLLMGGDYQEGCQYVPELFAALAKVKTPMGTYGVMGNNDYERCHDEIIREMQRYGMRPLEHQIDTLRRDGAQIILAGVRNPFDLANNGVSPTLSLSPSDFVILLVHTRLCRGCVQSLILIWCWQGIHMAGKSGFWDMPHYSFTLWQPFSDRIEV